MNGTKIFDQIRDYHRETRLLQSIGATLDWDQQTGMPEKATPWRAEQSAWVAAEVHRRQTDPAFGELLQKATASGEFADPHSPEGATVRLLWKAFTKLGRMPERLVREQSLAHSLGQQAWVEARKANRFDMFAPHLEKILRLKREEAELTGVTETLYDALLDDYEPDARTDDVVSVLRDLAERLMPLVDEVRNDDPQSVAILKRSYPVDAQRRLAREAAETIGFDFSRGRIDVAAHPFCTELGPDDVRLTTRYDTQWFSGAFFGTLHEAGHGLYEQGLPTDWYGMAPGIFCSLGIHESQSRLWENLVGRNPRFWEHFFPRAVAAFPETLKSGDRDEFVRAVNNVHPSLIRVEADEVTYNLHVIIRVELELALLNGELSVADLPGAWNQAYQKYLGIEPPDDASGVLQDVHWSAGLFGYFSTYSLGNIMAAQFWQSALASIPDLETQFAEGQFEGLLRWLRTHIHGKGARWPSLSLLKNVTGQELDATPLVESLATRLKATE